MNTNKIILITILIAFCISISFSFYVIKNFDNFFTINDFVQHGIIKSDTSENFVKAEILRGQIQDGKNILTSNVEYTTSYLHPKILLFFSEIFNFLAFKNAFKKN